MPYQDFDAARRERLRAFEPIRFQLGGHTFTCVGHPSLADSFDLLDAPEPTVEGAPIAAGVRALANFIEKSLVSDRDRRRFRKLLGRRDDPIDATTVVELGEWLAVQYAGPTVRPSSFSDGSRTNGTDSNTADFSQDSASVP